MLNVADFMFKTTAYNPVQHLANANVFLHGHFYTSSESSKLHTRIPLYVKFSEPAYTIFSPADSSGYSDLNTVKFLQKLLLNDAADFISVGVKVRPFSSTKSTSIPEDVL